MENNNTGRVNRKQMIPIMLTAFITPFMGSSLNLSIPSMSQYFTAGAVSVGWVVTAYFLSSTSLLIPFGRLADLYGKKPMFLTGILLFGIFSVLCAFAGNIQMVVLFRLGQGTGASMLFATNSAMIASNFPASMRGQMMGLSVMCTYLGLSAGPVLGGLLNQYLGWRAIFIFAALYCIPSLLTSLLMLDGDRKFSPSISGDRQQSLEKTEDETRSSGDTSLPGNRKMDIPGCILFTVACATFLFGLTSLTTMKAAKWIFLISLVLIVLFVQTELRSEAPVLDLRMFTGSRVFTLSNIAALLNYGASSSISYLLSVYLQNVRGLSSARAGVILIATPIIQAVLSPIAGKLSDRHSPFKLASVGMTLTCVGIVLLFFTDAETSFVYLILSLAVIGMGFALFSSPNSNAIMSSADRSHYGVASSIMSASRTIGQTSSMAIVTMVIGAVIGNVTLSSASPELIVLAIHIALVIDAVLCGIGIFCSASR